MGISVLSNLLLSDTASTVKSSLTASKALLSTDDNGDEVGLMATEGGATSEPTGGRQAEEDSTHHASNEWSELEDNADQVNILGECIASVLGRGLIDIALLSDSSADPSPVFGSCNTPEEAAKID